MNKFLNTAVKPKNLSDFALSLRKGVGCKQKDVDFNRKGVGCKQKDVGFN